MKKKLLKKIKNINWITLLTPLVLLLFAVPMFIPKNKTNNLDSNVDLKSKIESIDKIADQEVIELNKRLTNDQLSELSSSEIFKLYNESGQERLSKIFSGNDSARDYALTLIGKVIPTTTLVDSVGNKIALNNKSIVVILNTREKSKEFSKTLLETQFEEGTKPIIIFPAEDKEKVSEFTKETGLNNGLYQIVTLSDNPKTSSQPDLLGIAEFYFNAKGVPSYVSIDTNSITMAGSGKDPELWKTFIGESFKKPYLYNETVGGNDGKSESKE